MSLAACTSVNDKATSPRDQAIQDLQHKAGAPVALEVGDAGDVRVLAMTPRFPVPGHDPDPMYVAMDFLTNHHDAFQLDATEARQFIATRIDNDPTTDLHHVTLNRVYDGIPVFQGAISVHMDAGNGVFRVLGDPSYRIAAPTNRMVLSPAEAVVAAGKALGVKLSPVVSEPGDRHAVFSSAGALDPIYVDAKIFHVADGNDRFAYQATVSWLDDENQQQYQLALIDADDGSLLFNYSLVNTFTGRVFSAAAQPTANMTTDTRTVVSFDGDPVASPSGWVDATRKTRGNNAIAATDLDRNNTVGANEIQPTANADNSFDFPFSPLQNASLFREAAVTNAFFYVNDWHDQTYGVGFTEASGNFQTNNFGRGGAQNDEVQVDVQDGSGTNNANFATPPDGQRPRMQMFLFTLNGGAQEDGDFDPTVVYHENTHGLSNRLVGGGTTACLGGIQSGGMGEGWSDWVAASILNNPVIGAYVTGNPTVGIRRASMANSPFSYANIKDGTMTEVHDAGEVWAATLWDVRTAVGGPTACRVGVGGMKLTPCNPTMLQARDGIIQADANLNGGANRCKLWAAFARRQMGTGASSPNHNSTSQIVLSTAVPSDCVTIGGVTRTVTSVDVPKPIPDNNATGATSTATAPAGLPDTLRVTVDVNISHTFVGDLVIQVISPTGQTATLSNRAGGSADNFIVTGMDISTSFPTTSVPSGPWRLFVRDLAAVDVGTINSFVLHITSTN